MVNVPKKDNCVGYSGYLLTATKCKQCHQHRKQIFHQKQRSRRWILLTTRLPSNTTDGILAKIRIQKEQSVPHWMPLHCQMPSQYCSPLLLMPAHHWHRPLPWQQHYLLFWVPKWCSFSVPAIPCQIPYKPCSFFQFFVRKLWNINISVCFCNPCLFCNCRRCFWDDRRI